jgi:hypothetical protein
MYKKGIKIILKVFIRYNKKIPIWRLVIMMWFAFLFTFFTYGATYQVGDIIMQRDPFKGGGGVLQMMTLSPYNHIGVVIERNGRKYVAEAIGRVSYTPIDAYINRGVGYKILRPSKALTPTQKKELSKAIHVYKGKRYDPAVSWSDDKMYCSELVFKGYEDIGIQLKRTRPMWLHIFAPIVPIAKLMSGASWIPVPKLYRKGVQEARLTDRVVTPGEIARSWKLKTIRK